jgi:hypothetical protein
MKAKQLFIAIGVAMAILAGYNGLIAHTARTSQRQRARATLERLPASAGVVFLGNSLVAAGCDPSAFTSAWPQAGRSPIPVNLALGATTPVEHCIIWRSALEHNIHPKYLVYGFFDDQLNAEVQGDWSDLVGNRAFSYYFPERAAELYAPGSTLERWELSLTRRVPMLAERSSLWTQIELLRRKFEDIGMPKKKTNRFGRVDDFGALEATGVGSFDSRCSAVVDEKEGFSRPICEIVRLAREHGVKVIFVEMPMPSRHRGVFYSLPVWPRMREHLQALAAAAGATYVNASDWVRDDQKFEDAMHLNADGAKFFSARLAKSISLLDAPAAQAKNPSPGMPVRLFYALAQPTAQP